MTFKCKFCSRIGLKEYSIKFCGTKTIVCSECKYVYSILKEQILANRLYVIKKLITMARFGNRHCSKCVFFINKTTRHCKKEMVTHGSNRLRTYASSGCTYYTEKR